MTDLPTHSSSDWRPPMTGEVVEHPVMRGKDDLLAAIGYARAALVDHDSALAVLSEAVSSGVMSSRQGIELFCEIQEFRVHGS